MPRAPITTIITTTIKPGAIAFHFTETKQMCKHGVECWNEGRDHNKQFAHPSKQKCKFERNGTCEKHDDEDHMRKWLHKLNDGKTWK